MDGVNIEGVLISSFTLSDGQPLADMRRGGDGI